ncbi:MAG: hypothetical protein NTV06_04835 [candidate division Zixibacteria bacterium]|nr:hypothetical protein [candidate division Zixibacteria bacterium]
MNRLSIGRNIFPLLILAVLAFAQSAIANQPVIVRHPDGILGRPNGHIFGEYASVTDLQKADPVDQKILGVALKIPATRNLTFGAAYFARQSDSLYHNYRLELSFYIISPIVAAAKCNPDGAIGAPIILAGFGGEVSDLNIHSHRNSGTFQVIIPCSRKLTVGGGAKIFQKDNPRQVESAFGIVNIYSREYETDQPYSNPDGMEGSIAFLLKGGGSKYGIFGQLDFVFPLEPTMTLTFYLRGERIPLPYVRLAIVGFHAAFYPSNF